MVLAEISLADVLWAILAFFFLMIVLWMVFGIVSDIFRSDDLSGGVKAAWCIALLLLPWLTVFIYLIGRGNGMGERALKAAIRTQARYEGHDA